MYISVLVFPVRMFQFSIGDALTCTFSTRTKRHADSFNSLLEMPAGVVTKVYVDVSAGVFQFSIGDAQLPRRGAWLGMPTSPVSILYWRCEN